MTNEERLDKMQQALDLLIDVEFSYPQGHPTRKTFYAARVNTFGSARGYQGAHAMIREEIKEVERQRLFSLEDKTNSEK